MDTMRALLASLLVLALAAAEPAGEAAEFDTLIDAELAAAGLPLQPPADAATLARRSWLDLAGRIPTVAEAVTPTTPQRLIGSPAWRHATFTWLAVNFARSSSVSPMLNQATAAAGRTSSR